MKKMLLSLILFVSVSYSAFAQYGSSGTVDARSMGLGKTYNALSNGVYSIGINPSNMAYSKTDYVEFSTVLPLPSFAVSSGTNFMSIDEFNYFFAGENGKGKLLTTQDKARFNNLFSDGGEIFGGVSFSLLSVMYKADPSIGAFGFAINDFMGGSVVLPKALVDLGLNGNQIGKVYSFNDMTGQSWWIRSYSLSYAREIPEIEQDIFDKIAAGISLKMVSGYFYAGIDRFNTTLTTGANSEITGKADFLAYTAFSEDLGYDYDFDSTDNDQKSNAGPFPKSAGTGFGFDLGVSAVMDQVWKFSLAVTDIGSITWDKKAVQYTATGDLSLTDLTDQKQLDSLEDKISGQGQYIGSFATSLPTALRVGTSYWINNSEDDIPGSLLLGLDFNMGFNDMPGNSKKPRISTAAEWTPLDWLDVRTGLSFGGHDGFNWAFGLGLDAGIVEFQFATSDMQSFVAPNSAKRISVSLGSRWKI